MDFHSSREICSGASNILDAFYSQFHAGNSAFFCIFFQSAVSNICAQHFFVLQLNAIQY